MKSREELDRLSKVVVDSFFSVHKEMGPGLLENIYTYCLIKEFQLRELNVLKEVFVPLNYKGFELPKDFRIDLLVEGEIIIEVKAVDIIHPVYEAQIISYLKLTDKRLGFLVNFNVPLIKDGIKRFVFNF
ncbi:MAG: GxxExxY protein [Bacteroidota bacterium]